MAFARRHFYNISQLWGGGASQMLASIVYSFPSFTKNSLHLVTHSEIRHESKNISSHNLFTGSALSILTWCLGVIICWAPWDSRWCIVLCWDSYGNWVHMNGCITFNVWCIGNFRPSYPTLGVTSMCDSIPAPNLPLVHFPPWWLINITGFWCYYGLLHLSPFLCTYSLAVCTHLQSAKAQGGFHVLSYVLT